MTVQLSAGEKIFTKEQMDKFLSQHQPKPETDG